VVPAPSSRGVYSPHDRCARRVASPRCPRSLAQITGLEHVSPIEALVGRERITGQMRRDTTLAVIR